MYPRKAIVFLPYNRFFGLAVCLAACLFLVGCMDVSGPVSEPNDTVSTQSASSKTNAQTEEDSTSIVIGKTGSTTACGTFSKASVKP